MATNFPTSLDTFTNPNSGNTLDSPSHSVQHSDINDAVEAIEAKLGVGSSTAGSATAGYALVNTSGGTTAYSLLGVSGLSSGTAVANTVLTADGSSGVSFTTLPTSGLVLLNTTSFSGVASTSLTTDTFNSAYTNYRILIRMTNTTAGDMQYRFRAAGSDDTNSNYNSQFLVVDSTTVTGGRSTNSNVGLIGYLPSTETSFFDLTIFSPKASSRTAVQSFQSRAHGGTSVTIQHHFSNFNNTTSFDSMTFIPQTGAITGTYSVYGFNI